MVLSAGASEFVPLNTEEVERKGRRKKSTKKTGAIVNPTSQNKSSVIYVGRIPHGFYEDQMRGFFGQFGNIKRLRMSRNKKTGKSKHYAFIQFESPEVAEVVADSMHNYLLFEHLLQVKLVPLEKIHNRMWVGCNRVYEPPNWKSLERTRHNREKEPEEQQRMLKSLLKRERKRRKKIETAGIEYVYPDLERLLPMGPKKIKFLDSGDIEQ